MIKIIISFIIFLTLFIIIFLWSIKVLIKKLHVINIDTGIIKQLMFNLPNSEFIHKILESNETVKSYLLSNNNLIKELDNKFKIQKISSKKVDTPRINSHKYSRINNTAFIQKLSIKEDIKIKDITDEDIVYFFIMYRNNKGRITYYKDLSSSRLLPAFNISKAINNLLKENKIIEKKGKIKTLNKYKIATFKKTKMIENTKE